MDHADPGREARDAGLAMTPQERSAARVARWSALGSSLLVGIYLAVRLRPLAPVWRVTGRTIAALTIVIWYYLTYRIVKKVALEWQR